MKNWKEYLYHRGADAAMDAEFDSAASYGKVKLGETVIFWRAGLRWCAVPLSRVQRIYRQVELVHGKLCCGGASFDIQRLILVLDDSQTLELVVGDNEIGDQVKRAAENLFGALQRAHPELQYGKP